MQALRRIELRTNEKHRSFANVLSALARMASGDVKRLNQPNLKIVWKLWKNTNSVIYAWMKVISQGFAEAGSPVA